MLSLVVCQGNRVTLQDIVNACLTARKAFHSRKILGKAIGAAWPFSGNPNGRLQLPQKRPKLEKYCFFIELK
jgi:hypothetical protein